MTESFEITLPVETNRFFRDYAEGTGQAIGCFPIDWKSPDWNSVVKLAARKNGKKSEELSDLLIAQCEQFGLDSTAVRNARKLSGDAVCVVTGQQPGLMGGPLFTLLKALTCIKLAEHISVETGMDTVPVFWIEAEDHDREEIGTANILQAEGGISRLEIPAELWPEGMPAAMVDASSYVQSIGREIRNILEKHEFGSRAADMISESYRDENVPGGFARLLSRLLPPGCGMVFLDPSQVSVKALSRDFFRSAVQDSTSIFGSVTETTERLSQEGYGPQIKPRRDDSWLFLIENGRRSRIRREGKRFRSSLSDEVFDVDQLTQLATDSPELFSTGVALRPVLQDFLLPTAAYVGGPSEISYLAQIAGIYDSMDLIMPVVYPRAGMTIVEKPLFERSRTLFAEDDWPGRSEVGAIAKLISQADEASPERMLEDLRQSMADSIENIAGTMSKIDPNLEQSAKTAAEKIDYHLSKIRDKTSRARRSKKDVLAMEAVRTIDRVLPGGVLQERVISAVSLYARYGPDFVGTLVDEIKIDYAFRHKVLSMEIQPGKETPNAS
jgi:bacillithiol biosynthesis cysteine-adding enzyme BshC